MLRKYFKCSEKPNTPSILAITPVSFLGNVNLTSKDSDLTKPVHLLLNCAQLRVS